MDRSAKTQRLPNQMISSFQGSISTETHRILLDQLSLLSMLHKYQDLTLWGYLWLELTMHLMWSWKAHYVGFVTSNPDNRLIKKVLNKGDVFVFPVGLIHFQFNVGKTNAVAVAALSSQNPGVITIANAVFGSDPSINPDVLAKAFKLERNVVKNLQSKF
ncbi:hypothetical protein CRYUN_Cryun08bG0035700 [Craigia yunnanensis]